MRYGALIANWNGSDFIERCLGSVLAAARRAGEPIRIMVVDDASTDDSPERIASLFPSIELVRLPQNLGFGRAVNKGVEALNVSRIFLLNNDLALAADYFERLIAAEKELADPNLFAIGARTLQWETHEPNHEGMRSRWDRGLVVQEGFESNVRTPTDFVQGGSCLLDREKFLSLGGFCPIYHPGYWEDYDVAYQARRRGWNNFYEPGAVAYHWGKKSMRTLLGDYRLGLTIRRNHLLFNWVNLSDGRLLARHLLSLGSLVLRRDEETEAGMPGWGRALLAALGKLPEALRIRRQRLKAGAKADREILEINRA